ncbi:hypothetical protein MAUC95_26480 [Mycobacteroides abscessus]|nr:hypothetical protein MAUC95_26390 [Mycobacteroides abscessus]KNB63271.1 hypothetical protein MAUC95_26480 [Mycobacteroides abscessus]
MQRPHRGPAAGPVVHPPRREPLVLGALAAAQDLRGAAQQCEQSRGTLNRAFVKTTDLGQGLVGGPAVTARAPVGVPGAGISDLQQGLTADTIVLKLAPDLPIPKVVGDRNGYTRPMLRPGP